ncbi:MAG: aspartate/glutamate racemase family protein [Azospirillaceae bacterium]
MRLIGVIGGMSWESTAVYYRLFNEAARERAGGLHSARLLVWSFDFAEIEALQAAGDWDGATARLADAARALKAAGAEVLVIATNTMHKMADAVQAAAGLPLVHIADATAGAARAAGMRRPLVLATRYTMEQDFYLGRLRDRHGLDPVVPDAASRETVHRIIYEELCRGVIRAESHAAYLDVIARMRANEGIDGLVYGCTEVGLLLDPADTDLPAVDSTRVHVTAALDAATG